MTEKYKVCPVCRTKNSPAVLECINCGNDLMGVKIVDDSIIEAESEQKRENAEETRSEELVRICDCGQENEVSARKCVSCGEDISDVIPSPRRKSQEQNEFVITSDDGKAELIMTCPGEHIIGREHELSAYLETRRFVSRKHAKLTVTSDGLFIENLSRANGTFLNNERLDDGIAYKLCIGDEIGLGGRETGSGKQTSAAYFIVGVK